MKKIIGVGNALVDILVHIDDDRVLEEMNLQKGAVLFPQGEQRVRVEERIKTLQPVFSAGGAAANTMKAAAMLGLEAAYVGKVGRDEMGNVFTQALQAQGVMPLLSVTEKAPTGTASTFVSPDGQRSFADQLGAAALLNEEDIPQSLWQSYDLLYVEGYLVQNHQLIQSVLRQAKEAGLETCLDLASYNIVAAERDFFQHLLAESIDIVFANEEESLALTEKPAEEAALMMGKWCSTAVVKLGEHGAMAFQYGKWAEAEAVSVGNVEDTTGAGDSFAAGFLWARAQGRPLADCLQAGNIVAAEMIQHLGATLPPEIWKRIKARL